MSISNSLLNDFVDIITSKVEHKAKITSYGVLREVNGKKFVKMDGSEILTPITEALGAEDGDRVSVEIINHKAIITGNFTEPPSSRTATSYLKTVEDGMIVGTIKDGKPVGDYLIIKNDGILICNQNGNVLSTFSGNEIILGNNSTANVRFCNNKVYIRTTPYSSNYEAVGDTRMDFRVAENIEYIDDGSVAIDPPYSEIIIDKDGIDMEHRAGRSTNEIASIRLRNTGIIVNTIDKTPFTVNGKEVVTKD